MDSEERDFVSIILEAKMKKDNEVLDSYYDYGLDEFGDKIDTLFEIADKRLNAKRIEENWAG